MPVWCLHLRRHTRTSKVAENVAQEEEREPVLRRMWSQNALQSPSLPISYRHTEKPKKNNRDAAAAAQEHAEHANKFNSVRRVTEQRRESPVAKVLFGIAPVQWGNKIARRGYFVPPSGLSARLHAQAGTPPPPHTCITYICRVIDLLLCGRKEESQPGTPPVSS